jgi:hypothetical protein
LCEQAHTNTTPHPPPRARHWLTWYSIASVAVVDDDDDDARGLAAAVKATAPSSDESDVRPASSRVLRFATKRRATKTTTTTTSSSSSTAAPTPMPTITPVAAVVSAGELATPDCGAGTGTPGDGSVDGTLPVVVVVVVVEPLAPPVELPAAAPVVPVVVGTAAAVPFSDSTYADPRFVPPTSE